MTDARLPDTWLLNPTLDKLSHEAWRFFTRALMYCNQQGTDGEIETLYLMQLQASPQRGFGTVSLTTVKQKPLRGSRQRSLIFHTSSEVYCSQEVADSRLRFETGNNETGNKLSHFKDDSSPSCRGCC